MFPGELDELLPKSVKQIFLFRSKPTRNFFSRIEHFIRRKYLIPSLLRKLSSSVWYINTIALDSILLAAEQLHVTCILHTYELEQMYAHLSPEKIKRIIEYPELIISNAEITTALLKSYGRKKDIVNFYPTLDTSLIKRDVTAYQQKRTELGIEKEEFLWVMSGTIDSNKDPLLFIEIASILKGKCKQARFMWIGGGKDEKLKELCMRKVAEAGLEKSIIWTGHVAKEYKAYFNCADGFVLTSKIESFSLVTLEALLLGVPVVANDCGGVAEILQGTYGSLVGGDNRAMDLTSEMEKYMDKTLLNDPLKQRQRAETFDIKNTAPSWNRILEKFFDQ